MCGPSVRAASTQNRTGRGIGHSMCAIGHTACGVCAIGHTCAGCAPLAVRCAPGHAACAMLPCCHAACALVPCCHAARGPLTSSWRPGRTLQHPAKHRLEHVNGGRTELVSSNLQAVRSWFPPPSRTRPTTTLQASVAHAPHVQGLSGCGYRGACSLWNSWAVHEVQEVQEVLLVVQQRKRRNGPVMAPVTWRGMLGSMVAVMRGSIVW